jgi:AIPR protein
VLWPADKFLTYVSEEVEGLKRTSGVTDTHGAFLLWTLKDHFDLDETAAQKAQTFSGSGDSGIDALWYDESRKRLTIIQAKTSEPLTSLKSFGTDAARDLDAALSLLQNPQVIKDPTLRRASLEYREAVAKGRSIELVALVSGNSAPALDRAVEVLNRKFDGDRKTFRGHHASIVQLKDLNMKFCDELTQKRVGSVDVPLGPLQGRTKFHQAFGDQAYVVDLDATVVGDWVKQFGYAIIASNLRYPLWGTRYNDGIIETLRHPTEKNRFWFYNNGITVICDEIRYLPSDADGPTLKLINPQIVNGCQTAFTIQRFMEDGPDGRQALSGVSVLARIIQTKSESGLALNGERIARFTNSQNAITERDLRANDQVQELLQRKFGARDYFYERKNGEWRAVKGVAGARARGGFRLGKLDNTKLGQLALAFWLLKPSEAKNDKRLLFNEGTEGFYAAVYKPDSPEILTAEDFLVPYLTNAIFELWWDDWLVDHKIRKTGYNSPSLLLRNDVLKNGNTYFVALLGQVLQEKYGIHFQAGGTSPDHAQLRELTDSLRSALDRYKLEGKSTALSRAIFATSSSILTGLGEFCRAQIDKNPGDNPRKVLVRRGLLANDQLREQLGKSWVTERATAFPDL